MDNKTKTTRFIISLTKTSSGSTEYRREKYVPQVQHGAPAVDGRADGTRLPYRLQPVLKVNVKNHISSKHWGIIGLQKPLNGEPGWGGGGAGVGVSSSAPIRFNYHLTSSFFPVSWLAPPGNLQLIWPHPSPARGEAGGSAVMEWNVTQLLPLSQRMLRGDEVGLDTPTGEEKSRRGESLLLSWVLLVL